MRIGAMCYSSAEDVDGMVCKRCGGSKLQRSRKRTEWEEILAVFGFAPVRCTECLDRRLRFLLFQSTADIKTEIADVAKPEH